MGVGRGERCLTLRCTRSATAGFARLRTRVNSNVRRHVPTYAWSCHACHHANPASRELCMYCGLPAQATGAAIAAKRRQLEWREPSRSGRVVTPELDEPLDLILALVGLPVLHQIVGVVCIALFGGGFYLYVTSETFLEEVLAIAAMLGANYGLYVLVKDSRRKK
jgi:hypothetical protein